jgi:hypothetical protein
MQSKQDKVAAGISFTKGLKQRIDKERGDVSRSKYVCRLLERSYSLSNNSIVDPRHKSGKNRRDSSDIRFPGLPSDESGVPK